MKTYYVQRPGNSFTPTLKPAMIIDNMIYLTQTNSITYISIILYMYEIQIRIRMEKIGH